MAPLWTAWIRIPCNTNTPPRNSLQALICIIVYGGVCVYLFDTMRTFQWLALGSVVGSAFALTPEYVSCLSLGIHVSVLLVAWTNSGIES